MTDFAGHIFTMESFTSQSTNGSGEITVSLQNTPVGDDSLLIQCSGVSGAYAEFASRSGTDVTVIVRKDYDKTNSPITGALSNLPGGVTEAVTLQAPGSSNSGSAVNDGSGQTTSPPHSHTTSIPFQYRHDHTPTFTPLPLTALASIGGLTITVGYAF